MPSLDWQLISVLTCVAGAAFIVARRAWQLVRPASPGQPVDACGSCGSCSAGSASIAARKDGSFISLDSLTPSASAEMQS